MIPFFLSVDGKLLTGSDVNKNDNYIEYISDPANPVPFTTQVTTRVPKPYMVEDQSFAADRNDVVVFQSEILKEDLEVLGKITADLYVSTSGTGCDWVVKVIDVIPGKEMGRDKDYQMLLRGDIMRSKFRNSLSDPEPMTPGKVTEVKFNLNDVAHTFKKGHRVMVQIQSSWFPLFDRNPQSMLIYIMLMKVIFRKQHKEYISRMMLNRKLYSDIN